MIRRLALFAAAAAMVFAADSPRVTYIKSFPGSTPAYEEITVEQNGAASYKESPDDDPETLQLEPPITAAIFDLSAKLNHFRQPLESGLKVANMGQKTFRWVDGSASAEVKFNYSQDANAHALQDWFERIADSVRAMVELRRAVRHDRLGVNDAVLQIQALWDQKRLAGTAALLPLLDTVAKDDAFINMARERAAALEAAIRASGKPPAE